MKLAMKGNRPRAFRDLDPKVRARELASLQEELRRPDPITKKRLDRWIGAAVDRKSLMTGAVFGGIRWPKAIGKPSTPTLFGGFEIKHDYLAKKYEVTPGGAIHEVSTWEGQPDPSRRDDSKEDYHRIAFMFFAVYFWPNRLTTRLLPEIHWDRPAGLPAGSRRLNPLGFCLLRTWANGWSCLIWKWNIIRG
jgi:hypothetical protein